MGAIPAPSHGQRLPSGRHRLTREMVVASQRGRLLDAAAQVVAEKGYTDTTVAEIVARAGVSRRTFYEQFADKEACFLAAYDTGVELVLGKMRDAVERAPASGWRERAEATVSTFMDILAGEPSFARSLHIEMLAAGPAALQRRAEVYALIAELWRRLHERARREDPRLSALPDESFLALTGGLDELIRETLRTRGAGALRELTRPALAVVFALLGRRNPPRVEVRWAPDPAHPEETHSQASKPS